MNDLVARYIYDVTRRLPEENRAEVKKELQANISDMLPSNPTEEQIKEVLKTLGNPRVLAHNYLGKSKSLISAEWMDDYLRVLKIVLIIFGTLAFIFGLIEHISHPEATKLIGIILEVIAKVISETIQSLIRGFAIVTIVFALISRYASPEKIKAWEPSQLPKLPKEQVVTIKRTSSVAGLIFTVIFRVLLVFLLINRRLYLAWTADGEWWVRDTLMFNDAAVKLFVPFIFISIVFVIVTYVTKIYFGHWNKVVAGIHTGEQLYTNVIALLFINHKPLLTAEFVKGAADIFEVSVTKMQEIFSGIAIVISVMIVLGVIGDLVTTWIKTLKVKA